ncbi:MAG: hypothetical protein AAB343_04310 [Patescibacteria group bacterium]
MKRTVYIFCTIVLGSLLGVIVHGFVELPIIALLILDIDAYGLGLTWNQWYFIHTIWSVLTFGGGIVGGYFLGVTWWRIVYIERRHWRFQKRS